MKVLKFGGTSVGSAQRIRSLAGIIPANEPAIVILSAMAGTTNTLVKINNLVRDGKMKEAFELNIILKNNYINTSEELFTSNWFKEQSIVFIEKIFESIGNKLIIGENELSAKEILAAGEILTSQLFYFYLNEQSKKSTLISALDFLKIDHNGEPDYHFALQQLAPFINDVSFNQVIITQGFICRNANGQIDNLGRGGSDYTAAIVGNAINAQQVEIWTDIDGIHNNDPRFVANTSPIRELSFDEAAELAYFGAKILHPATIHPCRVKNIPVVLKNTLIPTDPGTVITSKYKPQGIKAFAAKDGITAIKIRSSRMLMAYGFLRRVFEIFEEFKTPVDMITTSEVAVSLTIDETSNLEKIIGKLTQFSTVEVDANQTIICIVGDMVADNNGYASRIFNVLNHIPLRMISYGGSPNNISVLVSNSNKIGALQALQNLVTNYSLANA
jgi:aspartate kinase